VIELLSIQVGGLPACRIVTLVATGFENAFMAGRLRMTILARWRDSAEQADSPQTLLPGCIIRTGISVAAYAAHRAVLTFQRELGCGVIELRQTIFAIMAGEADASEFLIMLEHKRHLLHCMAGVAVLHIYRECRTLRKVARRASHRGQVIVELMMNQAEVSARMVVHWKGRLSWIEILSPVIRVTGCTRGGWRHLAMHAGLSG